MNYDFGAVVLVRISFTDLSDSKLRPAAVISCRGYNEAKPDRIIVPITSQLRGPTPFADVIIAHWRLAGLIKPSAFKLSITSVQTDLILRQLGDLTRVDQDNLRTAVDLMLG